MLELRADSITKRFGGVAALDDVSLRVEAGERRAIIGPNGAGKSTLFAVISGQLSPTRGDVEIKGRRTTGLPSERIARLGVARTFQTSTVFTESSVLENVMLAALPPAGQAWNVVARFGRLQACEQAARGALETVGLSARSDTPAGVLSHGESRQLEIAAALVQQPSLLLLDEPLAGLASAERERIGRLLRDLPKTMTVLLIEHDLDFAQSFADRMLVLNNGRVLAEGTPQAMRDNPNVRAAYLGTGGLERVRAEREPAGQLMLARGISCGYGPSLVLDDVSIDVGRGEVIAVLGRNGMGKSTLLNCLMGLVPLRGGSIVLDGVDLSPSSALVRARAGLALVPQGRRMLAGLSVHEELQLGARPGPWTLDRIRRLFPQLHQRERAQSTTLSGGEQQMVAIARALLRNPVLLMLDEPSEGLSPVLVRSLEETIASLRDDGETVLLAEQNVDLALAVADRIYILERGRVVAHETAASLAAHSSRLERNLGL